MPNGFVMDLSL